MNAFQAAVAGAEVKAPPSVIVSEGVYALLMAVPVTAVFCTVPVRYTVPLVEVTVKPVALLLSPALLAAALRPMPGTDPLSCSEQLAVGQV